MKVWALISAINETFFVIPLLFQFSPKADTYLQISENDAHHNSQSFKKGLQNDPCTINILHTRMLSFPHIIFASHLKKKLQRSSLAGVLFALSIS